MSDILSLFQYHRVNPTTWVYLSSLLTIGLFFKFNRFWSVRNLDLVLVLLLGPGLLMANFGLQMKAAAIAKIVAEQMPPPPPSDLETQEPADADPPDPDPDADPPDPDADPPDLDPDADPPDSDPDGSALPADAADAAPPPPAANAAGVAAKPVSGTSVGDPDEPAPRVPTPAELARRRAEGVEESGYVWLFLIGALLLVRVLTDPTMVRRPLLEPNLTVGGLTFSCCALFMFLMANVVTSTPIANEDPSKFGPGYRLLYAVPQVPVTRISQDSPPQQAERSEVAFGVAAKVMAILGHLAIVAGIILIGYRHFDNIRTGIGTATLYLLLPYTAQMTGRVDHVLPAALLVWAVYFYRRPMTAGVLVGLAGVVYYPLFLLPLWVSFYWQRGKMRFITGVALALGALVLALVFSYGMGKEFRDAFIGMFGLHLPVMGGGDVVGKVLAGIWNYYLPIYRLPLLAAFMVLSLSFALWPAQKNLGTLMCCSAAVMLAAQFWHRYNGGTYMAWYLPLLLLTIFRPNLEDRVAQAVLSERWFPRRRATGNQRGH